MTKPLVGILMGSDSDYVQVEPGIKILDEFKVPYEVRVLSAHRTPELVRRYVRRAAGRGLKIIIAAAGGAAHLAGACAAQTSLPIIGIPIETKTLKGLDSLLSTVQMPGGVPVATMAIGASGAKNAAIFACQVLGIAHKAIGQKVVNYKKRLADQIKTHSYPSPNIRHRKTSR